MAWSCGTKKEGANKVRFMKNVTAHYNIYFNAKELLKQSELAIQQSLENDFNQTLEIFPIPSEQSSQNETGNLNEVIKKTNTIALEKYESNWLDDAYLLLADAEYAKGDFYNAVEFYSYVSITFPKEKKNKLAAYLGQSKSDFAIGNYKEADSVLQLASKLKYKYYQDKLQASLAQLALKRNDFIAAIDHLEQAVNATKSSYLKIRWRYVLAQLQELNNQDDKAYDNYEKIVKSNASFEMSFNANLSRVRITESAEGKQFNKIATLNKLLKEDKNKEFKDQIYYQIANAYADKGDLKKATEYYQIASHTVPGTVKQKGLSYLKLAELNFDSLKNYTQAQLYYDSTLQYLPKNYIDYKNIAVKANNLQYLAERLTIIETQKQLLKFANLSDDEINIKVEDIIQQQQKQVSKTSALQSQSILPNIQQGSISNFSVSNQSGSSFYFYNSAALSQGLSEFKKRWGQRKLTDNWRSGSGSMASDVSKNNTQILNSPNLLTTNTVITPEIRDSIKADYIKTLPLSPSSKITANAKIATALYEIANFYKDVLKDDFEAAEAYEAIVLNYPNDNNAASIYYQLYRLLEGKDVEQSEKYKQQLLLNFPTSVFAKTISDPNYGKEEELLEQKIKDEYAGVYALYLQKKYGEVIQKIYTLKSNLESFKKLEPQFAYLEALAVGHTQKLPSFLVSLNNIVNNYPDNAAITPTVKQQLAFINKNKSVFELRPTALISYDANVNILSGQELVTIPKVEQPMAVPTQPSEVKKDEQKPQVINKFSEVKKEESIVQQPVTAHVIPIAIEPAPDKPKAIVFSDNERQKHLIIIDINDPTVNIAKPFSRVSQYFYSKFDQSKINIVIRVVDRTDKFIIVNGEFYSRAEANKAAIELEEKLPELMEGLKNQYRKFVVSESNLKLLLNNDAVEQYIKSISDKK
jgi:tetratricopeptide (TPR) repeat protein